MHMATAKIGVRHLSATATVAKAQGIHDMLVGNALYPAPVPSLAVFQGQIDALAKGNAAVDNNGGKADFQARNVARAAVLAAIRSLRGYVQTTSGGDAVMIQKGGFDVVEPGGRIGELDPPTMLVTRSTTMSGRASFAWKRDYGAHGHHVFMSTSNDPFNWVMVGATTKCRYDVDKLVSGRIYWFAVTAIGTAGESSKSEPLMARASG